MADPVTLALIGAGVSAATSVVGGFAARGAAEYNADVAQNNAQLARQRAEAQAAERSRLARLDASRRVAGAAARGVQFSGTMLDVASQNLVQDELEARYIVHGGETQARALRAKARNQKLQGKVALGTSFLRAGGTLLTGGAQAMQMKSPGGMTDPFPSISSAQWRTGSF